MYDSAFIKGIEQSSGIRIPKLPKQKEKFLPEKGSQGNPLLPKTIKDQAKEAKKPLKKGQVSIDIRRPVLTVDGFKINKKDIDDKKKRTVSKERVN